MELPVQPYESPRVIELGSVADFTRADGIGLQHDNNSWLSSWGIHRGWDSSPTS